MLSQGSSLIWRKESEMRDSSGSSLITLTVTSSPTASMSETLLTRSQESSLM